MSLTKKTKAELIEQILENEENKFDILKTNTGLPYQTEEEWGEYIKNIQTQNAKLLKDVNELTERLSLQNIQLDEYLSNSIR